MPARGPDLIRGGQHATTASATEGTRPRGRTLQGTADPYVFQCAPSALVCGYQLTTADPLQLRDEAVAPEEAGFDVLCSFDHLVQGFDALSPLAFVAAWTKNIRICPLVVNNDFHHPALLAQELAALDLLSDGRLEVGIGAGHSFTEYTATGIAFEPPDRRKARLAESVEAPTPPRRRDR